MNGGIKAKEQQPSPGRIISSNFHVIPVKKKEMTNEELDRLMGF